MSYSLTWQAAEMVKDKLCKRVDEFPNINDAEKYFSEIKVDVVSAFIERREGIDTSLVKVLKGSL